MVINYLLNVMILQVAFSYFANAWFFGKALGRWDWTLLAACRCSTRDPWYSAAASLSKEFPALQCLSNHATCVTKRISRWWFLKDLLAVVLQNTWGWMIQFGEHMFYINWCFKPPPRVTCVFCAYFLLLVTDHPDQPRSITQQSMVERCLWFCEGWSDTFEDETMPRCCMFTSTWVIFVVNVGKYTRHGCYGYRIKRSLCRFKQPTFVCTRWLFTDSGFITILHRHLENIFFPTSEHHLMCWFGVRWFEFLVSTNKKGIGILKGTRFESQTITKPTIEQWKKPVGWVI